TRSKRDWSSDVCSSDLGRLRGLVVREEVPPGLVDGVAVVQVLLIKLLDQPLVRAEICQGLRRLRRHGGDRPLPQLACECVWRRVEIGRASCRERGWRMMVG